MMKIMRSLLVVLAFWGQATAVCAQHKTSSVQVNVVATTDTLRGFQLSLLNAANKTYGMQLSPLINVAHYLHGVQIGTMGNMATGSMRGVQLSAVNNMAGDVCGGLQLSALTNVSMGCMRGVQLGAYNYADSLSGVQLGLVNIAVSHPRGVQVGLINYTRDADMRKVGLINIDPNTRIDVLAFGGNTSKLNTAVRFRHRSTYSMVALGTHYMGLDRKFSGALSYRLGQYVALSPRWSVSADLGFSHIETFEEHSDDNPRRLYSLQGHLNVDYQFCKTLGAFASVGYGNTRHYGSNRLFEQKLILQAGLSVNWKRNMEGGAPQRRKVLTEGDSYVVCDSIDNRFALAPRKRPWLAAAEVAGVNALVFSYDRWVANASYSRISMHTIRHNFKTGFVWDNDPFATNLFAHPYHGNLYFNSARSNGLNFWASVPYALCGSLMWEFCGENEPPAINDVFATALGGTCIGEMTNRVSHLVLDDSRRGFPRFAREALAFLVNPIQGFNRLLRGDAWTVRTQHHLYHDFNAIPVHLNVSLGLRYLSDDGALFRGEYNPTLALAMEYGDAYNSRTNRPYDYFTAAVNVGFSPNQPTIYGAHLMGRLWAAPVYEHGNTEARFGIFQHFNYYNSEPVKDGSDIVPYRISEAVGIGPAIMVRFTDRGHLASLSQQLFTSGIILGGSKSDYYNVIDRDYNMGSGYSLKTRTRLDFQHAGTFALDIDYFRIFTWKGYETKNLENREPLYYNVQGDKSNAELCVITPRFVLNIKGGWAAQLSWSYFLRHTRYVYHNDVRSNTFNVRLALSYRI